MKTLFAFAVAMCATVFGAEKSSEEKAANFLNNEKVGLCASMMDKEPYLSVMPYALDDGQPFVFISDLAQHTENINKSGKVSFLIYKLDPDDIFNATRVTFQGTMKKVSNDNDKEFKRLAEIYGKRFPDAKQLFDFADFHFYKMKVKDAHWIGGFGDIDWLDVKKFLKDSK